MNLNEKIKFFPNDIIFNYSNHQILRDISKEDLSEIKKPLYVVFNNFDILEFSYNKFKSKGIVTARHSPKEVKFIWERITSTNTGEEWSFYYDSYVKGNELDFYHDNMKRIKRKIIDYIDNFYDPFHEVDVNMTIIKTVKRFIRL